MLLPRDKQYGQIGHRSPETGGGETHCRRLSPLSVTTHTHTTGPGLEVRLKKVPRGEVRENRRGPTTRPRGQRP